MQFLLLQCFLLYKGCQDTPLTVVTVKNCEKYCVMELIIQQYTNSTEHFQYRLLVNATHHSCTQHTN
jgi:hypothetical protein